MSSKPPAIVEVTRGHDDSQHVESLHLVDIVICDPAGRIVETRGDADRGVFPRSAIKAIQALPLVESGAADAFGFSEADLALACASHNGEPIHTAASENMLKKAGLTAQCLECGAQLPFHPSDHEALARAQKPVTALHNNCSGKHAGFLAFASHTGLPTDGYIHFGHSVQQEVAGALEAVTGAPHSEENYGIDGCSIPTYEIRLQNLAFAFAKLAAGEDKGAGRRKAMTRLRDACMTHPEMVAGRERFDTELMTALKGRAFTKTGAEGVFVIALPELGLGAALKCHDGTTRAAEVACAAVVESLLEESQSGLSPNETKALKRLSNPDLRNWNGFKVGEIRFAG